jgi:hypothetical protein
VESRCLGKGVGEWFEKVRGKRFITAASLRKRGTGQAEEAVRVQGEKKEGKSWFKRPALHSGVKRVWS